MADLHDWLRDSVRYVRGDGDLTLVAPTGQPLGQAEPTARQAEKLALPIGDEDVELLRRTADELEEALNPRGATWRVDPVRWAAERGVSPELWSRQREVLEALRDHDRVTVPTCHTVGKDHTAAVAVCWWLDPEVHPKGTAFCLTTAPTGDQVKGILWRYINRMADAAELPGRRNHTEWWLGSELVALGRKPSEYNPTALQGYHAEHMLIVLDEASGMDERLWDALDTLVSSGGKVLAIGNPDDSQSRFAQVCQPGSGWHVIQVGAKDTPNFTGEEVSERLGKSLISVEWAERKLVEWGADSPLYQSKVLGLFPEEDTEWRVLPASWVARCRLLQDAPLPDVPVWAGLDVGESGDRTVLAIRAGGRLLCARTLTHGPDAMDCVGQVVPLLVEFNVAQVSVDAIGVGWGVASRLRELSRRDKPTNPDATHSTHVAFFKAGEASREPARFLNKRAELWWGGRELSRTQAWDLSILTDDQVAELTMPRYKLEGSKSRIQVESKDELRKRLGRSPDVADAVLQAWWDEGQVTAASIPNRVLEMAATRV